MRRHETVHSLEDRSLGVLCGHRHGATRSGPPIVVESRPVHFRKCRVLLPTSQKLRGSRGRLIYPVRVGLQVFLETSGEVLSVWLLSRGTCSGR